MVSSVSNQSGGDQLWSRECHSSQLEISSGPQNVLPDRWRSVVVPRMSYLSSGDQ